jgi:lipopolysaccharide biosynthesis glycosyltransferase
MNSIYLATSADRNFEIGLHVTLYSAMKHLDKNTKAKIYLILKDYGEKEIANLNKTLHSFEERCELVIFDVNEFDLGKGRGLHGNMMPYTTLLFPTIVPSDRVLYLDSDLLVLADLAPLYDYDMGQIPVAAVGGTLKYVALPQERDFLIGLGISGDSLYFNTGVVLYDVNLWNSENYTQKCFDFSFAYPNNLYTADQTVFNGVMNSHVCSLPPQFNRQCPSNAALIDANCPNTIHHFVGSPKPWDFLGEVLHRNHALFHSYVRQTFYKNYKSYFDLSPTRLQRLSKLMPSYLRTIRTRMTAG